MSTSCKAAPVTPLRSFTVHVHLPPKTAMHSKAFQGDGNGCLARRLAHTIEMTCANVLCVTQDAAVAFPSPLPHCLSKKHWPPTHRRK